MNACAAGLLLYSAVKRGIGEVDVFLAQTLLGQAQTFAEVSNLSKGLGTQCLQGFRGFFGVGENCADRPVFPPVLALQENVALYSARFISAHVDCQNRLA